MKIGMQKWKSNSKSKTDSRIGIPKPGIGLKVPECKN